VHSDLTNQFFIYIYGEFILMFGFNKIAISTMYIAVWFIPACIITVQMLKKGLFIWGSKKVEKKATKSFKKNVIIGSLCFGIIMGGKELFSNGAFNPKGILWILGYALGWGIPFYFMMNALIKTSEKKADNELKKIEEESTDKI